MAANKAQHLFLCSAGSLEHLQERFRNQGRLFFVITVRYESINKCFSMSGVLAQSGRISAK